MEKYIVGISDRNPNANEGYSWAMRETVYVPIIKASLSITKRSHFSLPLLDEMTLRLLSEGVNEIEEISKILGIERRLLDITVADLYTKDLVHCSAGRCTLKPKGKEVLQQLKITRRQKDVIRNVFYDPINKTILDDYSNIQFIDRVDERSKKLEADFDSDNIEIFREHITAISKIFIEEMNIYNDHTKVEPDELLTIDSIDKIFVKFIKIPIYIYISNSGSDIDVLPVYKSTKKIFINYREEIVEQIRELKLFRNKFYNYMIDKQYHTPTDNTNLQIKSIIEKHKGKKWKIEEREILFETEVLKNRKLLDDEFTLMLEYLCKTSNNILVKVGHLDEWKSKEILREISAEIGNEKLVAIKYSSCNQFDKCAQTISKWLPKCEKRLQQNQHDSYLKIYFDNNFIITGVPINMNILDSSTYIHKIDFFLKKS